MKLVRQWLRTTFDYNPSFPISAFLLLFGLTMLGSQDFSDHALNISQWTNVAIVQFYEWALLLVALLILWPRKISYETTSILIIFSVLRFASPFFVSGFSVDSSLFNVIVCGLALTLSMAAKTKLCHHILPLPVKAWQRYYDLAIFAAIAIFLPMLSHYFSTESGAGLDYGAARVLRSAMTFCVALMLLPLATQFTLNSEVSASLQSERWQCTWRGVTFLGVIASTVNVLWINNSSLAVFEVLPLFLVGTAVAHRIYVAVTDRELPIIDHLPAFLFAIALFGQSEYLGYNRDVTRLGFISAFGILAVIVIPIIKRNSQNAYFSLAMVFALAPLKFMGSLSDVLIYCQVIGVIGLVISIVKKNYHVASAFVLTSVACFLAYSNLFNQVEVNLASDKLILTALISIVTHWLGHKLDRDSILQSTGVGLYCAFVISLMTQSTSALVLVSLVPTMIIHATLLSRRSLSLMLLTIAVGIQPIAFKLIYPTIIMLVKTMNIGAVLVFLGFAGLPIGSYLAIKRNASTTFPE